MEPEKTPRDRAEDLISLLLGWRPTRQQSVWAIRLAVVLVVLVAIGHAYDITLLDWLKLLIVPAVIAGVGIWFSRQQRKRELKIAKRRAQDEALQAYLDKMTDLLVDKKLGVRPPHNEDEPQKNPVRTVAWARTKTVLRRLNGRRKGAVVRFLREADLINIEKERPVILNLAGADLVGADLEKAVLKNTALKEVVLRKAVLRKADLTNSDLTGADLTDAEMKDAVLTNTNLTHAQVTEEQLDQAKSLEGATMPDGQQYEDWIKDRQRREKVVEED